MSSLHIHIIAKCTDPTLERKYTDTYTKNKELKDRKNGAINISN